MKTLIPAIDRSSLFPRLKVQNQTPNCKQPGRPGKTIKKNNWKHQRPKKTMAIDQAFSREVASLLSDPLVFQPLWHFHLHTRIDKIKYPAWLSSLSTAAGNHSSDAPPGSHSSCFPVAPVRQNAASSWRSVWNVNTMNSHLHGSRKENICSWAELQYLDLSVW